MTKVSPLHRYEGPLRVIIHTKSGLTREWHLSLMSGKTLFDNIGHACAICFTNLTTRLQIATKPADWRIDRFSRKQQVLEATQIDGPELTEEPDDPQRLGALQEAIADTTE